MVSRMRRAVQALAGATPTECGVRLERVIEEDSTGSCPGHSRSCAPASPASRSASTSGRSRKSTSPKAARNPGVVT